MLYKEISFLSLRRSVCASNRSGVSLIEILVAIAILSVLGVMVMGFWTRSVVSAQSAVGVDQLKQIWMALNMYRADNNNYYPAIMSPWPPPNGSEVAWTRQPLGPYLALRDGSLANRVFVCPNADYPGYEHRQLTRTYATTGAMVGMNAARTTANDTRGIRHFHTIERPESTILLFDAAQTAGSAWSEAATLWLWVVNEVQGMKVNNPRIDYRQSGKAHFMFVDGHLETMTPKQVANRIRRPVWDGMWFLE